MLTVIKEIHTIDTSVLWGYVLLNILHNVYCVKVLTNIFYFLLSIVIKQR